MAAVHLGRLVGPAGFSRTIAVKRLHPTYAKDPDFVTMFVDEARLAARVQHPNVVPTLDVVASDDELFLVMEYVRGETMSRLLRAMRQQSLRAPFPIVSSVITGVLHGLHAAHEAHDEAGEPLGIVHRDVSPQNILVGTDGVARVLDFGVAKAVGRLQTTQDGQIKGKIAYMAPEQLNAGVVTRRSDVYSASVVLWEALTGQRLFQGDSAAYIFGKVVAGDIASPETLVPDVPPELIAITMRGLSANPDHRFATAREMALALEGCIPPAPAGYVGEWVRATAAQTISKRDLEIHEMESSSRASPPQIRELLPNLISSPAFAAANAAATLRDAPQSAENGSISIAIETRVEGRDDRRQTVPTLTQASTVGVSFASRDSATPPPPVPTIPPTRSSRRWIPITAILVLLLGVFVVARALRTNHQPVAGGESNATGHSGDTQQMHPTDSNNNPTLPDSATPPSSAAPPTTASANPTTAPTASKSAPPIDSSIVPPPLPIPGPNPTPTARHHNPGRNPGPKPSGDCDPPYTRDESGVKIYKPECLK
jgi:serine/threonine protein kinase